MSTYAYINNIFSSAKAGAVIRRRIASIKRMGLVPAFIKEAKARNYQLIETTDHFIVICDSDNLTIHR
jgi:hypothetical protein